MLQALARNKSIGFGVIVVVVISILALVIPSYWVNVLTRVLIMALFATSINIQVGYTGMLPLGQSLFLGFGAYSFGLLVMKGGIPLTFAFLAALILSAIISAIIGYLCLRGDSMTFGLLHLAFNMLSYTIVIKWITFTGGDTGIIGIPRPSTFSDARLFFYFVLVAVSICYVLIGIIMNSPFGKVAQGLRENEERLRFLGINSKRFQLVICVISGLFTAVAGVLLAMLDKGVFPAYMSLTQSAGVLVMCLIGGMSSFLGPSIGAAIVVIISTMVSNYIAQWQGLLGIIMIVCVTRFSGGILGRRKGKIKIVTRRG